MRATWLVLALLLVPAALAQERSYDPLVLSYRGSFTADGKIDEVAPASTAIPFVPGAPPAPASSLRFTLAAPVRFTPGAPFAITIHVRADAPVVARDADGNAFEISVEPGGEPVRIAIDPPVMAPGTVASATARVVSGELYAEGDEIAVLIRPLMTFTAGALSLMVGGDTASGLDAPDLRVPTPADLRLQDVPHTEFLLEGETFEPPASHAVNVFSVMHGAVQPPAAGAWSPNGTYVVLRGDEPDDAAAAHEHAQRARRVEAAHELEVNGVTARVHPGIGVVVRVLSAPIRVECARNCPAGFSWSYAPSTATPTGEPPSTLVPPPRDTRGIPVSADEPEGSQIPLPPLLALAVLALAAISKR